MNGQAHSAWSKWTYFGIYALRITQQPNWPVIRERVIDPLPIFKFTFFILIPSIKWIQATMISLPPDQDISNATVFIQNPALATQMSYGQVRLKISIILFFSMDLILSFLGPFLDYFDSLFGLLGSWNMEAASRDSELFMATGWTIEPWETHGRLWAANATTNQRGFRWAYRP